MAEDFFEVAQFRHGANIRDNPDTGKLKQPLLQVL
jgi:hypothetical protein